MFILGVYGNIVRGIYYLVPKYINTFWYLLLNIYISFKIEFRYGTRYFQFSGKVCDIGIYLFSIQIRNSCSINTCQTVRFVNHFFRSQTTHQGIEHYTLKLYPILFSILYYLFKHLYLLLPGILKSCATKIFFFQIKKENSNTKNTKNCLFTYLFYEIKRYNVLSTLDVLMM